MNPIFAFHPSWPPGFVPVHPVAETLIAVIWSLKRAVERVRVWDPKMPPRVTRFLEVLIRLAWSLDRLAQKPPAPPPSRPQGRSATAPDAAPSREPRAPARRLPWMGRMPARAGWLTASFGDRGDAVRLQAGELKELLSTAEAAEFLAGRPGLLRGLSILCRGLGIVPWPEAPPGLFPADPAPPPRARNWVAVPWTETAADPPDPAAPRTERPLAKWWNHGAR